VYVSENQIEIFFNFSSNNKEILCKFKQKIMKRLNFFLLVLFSVLMLKAQEPQIENSNFENWTDSHSAVNWNSVIHTGFFDIYTADRTTDAYDGTYAASLTTQESFGYTIPGIIQLGELVLVGDSVAVVGGEPFASRPTGLRAFLKYTPVNNDTAFIISYLTRYDTLTGSTDTIGGTFYPVMDTVLEYTEINVPFLYDDTLTSDTINIICISSNPMLPQTGSHLVVDSIYLIYEFFAYPTLALSATDVTDTSFTANWMPSPLSSEYYLDVATDSNFINVVPGYDDLLVDTFNFRVSVSGDDPEYYYRVRVKYGDTATSINSNVIKVTPSFPTVALPATEITSTSFRANWKSMPNAQNYLLDVATDEQFENFVSGYENLSTADTNYYVTGLNDTMYYYRVRTQYQAGTSSNSNTIAVSLVTSGIREIQMYENYVIRQNSLYLYDLPAAAEIYIYDIAGKEIYHQKVTNSSIVIPIRNSGIYVLKVRSASKDWLLKFSI
jgi:hypothetical protein